MTASKKMNKAQKQKLAAIQEKKALNRALKKFENKGAKFVRLTQAEEEAFYNCKCKEEASKQQNISKEKEEQQTTLTMRLPKDVANYLTEENILTALNNFVNGYAMKEAPKTFLQRAEALIKGDRQRDYGDKLANFAHIAMFFQAVLAPKLSPGNYISPEEVGMMMQGVKMARMIKSPDHADSVLDNAGYAGCIGELQAERLALKTPPGAINDTNAWTIPNVGS